MTTDAIKRWRQTQNQTSFNKFYKGSYENEPKMKMYECVKDDEIKGILFKINYEKVPDVFDFLIGYPNNSPTNVPKEKEVLLYYYSWKTNRIGPKRNFNNKDSYFEQVKISANECVIGTGRKAIPTIANAMQSKTLTEIYYEVLTTKGIVYIQKELLCPYSK
jgi:hypothetical protein